MARCFGYQPPESFLKLVEEMRSHGKKDIEKWIQRKSRREAKEAEKIKSKRIKHSHESKAEKEEGEMSDVTEEHGLPENPCSSSDSVSPRKSFTRIESKKKEMSEHELYETLTTGWTPPPLKLSEPEDLGWLVGSRKTDGIRYQTRSSEVQCNNVLVYALPYTVPF